MSINGLGRVLGAVEDRLRESGYSEAQIQDWRQQQLAMVAAKIGNSGSLVSALDAAFRKVGATVKATLTRKK